MHFLLCIFFLIIVPKTKVIRIFEAFAGIGSQRRAIDNICGNYTISGMAEWYIPAIISYQAIFNKMTTKYILKYVKKHQITRNHMVNYLNSKTLSYDSKVPVKNNWWDKKTLDYLRICYVAVKKSEEEGNIFDIHNLYKCPLKNIDLLTYSFPCQDLSMQGKQRGMSKDSNTRSGLLWQIEKALDHTEKRNLPKFLLMENVSALMYKTNKADLDKWLLKLKSLGYKNSIGILNAADFGSSQARKRVFMISCINKKIKLPIGNKKPRSIKMILNKENRDHDFLPALDKLDLSEFKLTNSNIKKGKLQDYTTFNSEAYVYDENFTGPTLTASGANSRIKIKNSGRIRKMNAKEAFVYMGFNRNDYRKVNNLNILSEIKMIYTCGNSISIQVLQEIMREVFND